MKHQQITDAFDRAAAENVLLAAISKCERVRLFLTILNLLPFGSPILRTARSLLRGYLEGWLKQENCA